MKSVVVLTSHYEVYPHEQEPWKPFRMVYRLNGRVVAEFGNTCHSVTLSRNGLYVWAVILGQELRGRSRWALCFRRRQKPLRLNFERYLTRLAAVNGIRLVIEEGATDGLDSGR